MAGELEWIAQATGATRAHRVERIQSLWSGYGKIVRVALDDAAHETVIVKSVKPPTTAIDEHEHSPRGLGSLRSHLRKCRSYDVEMAWYRGLAKRCDDACRVPALLASRTSENEWTFVLEDLDAIGFETRVRNPNQAQVEACLSWLAAFHARFLFVEPEGLWKIGTYWHLETRPDELARVTDETIRKQAAKHDRQLNDAKFQTLVHGDAKPANFCFARNGRSVAAVDFQYVGGGCGMKDVAYFLFDESGSSAEETKQLDFYFERLRAALKLRSDGVDIVALEHEWRALYLVAKADFYRFLAGWSV